MATQEKVVGADCALFPAVAPLDTMSIDGALTKPYRFTPTRYQVEVAEKQLNASGIIAIRSPLTSPDSANLAYIQTRLPAYKRQYFGFYNMQHQACLFIQLFEDDITGWLYHQLMILDGGPSVWDVRYNLDTKQFYALGYHTQG